MTHFIPGNSPMARVTAGRIASPTRKLATATALPAWSASFPPVGQPAEGTDPSATGYWIPVRRNPSAAMRIRVAVGHGTNATAKNTKWRIAGLRQRLSAIEGGNVTINDLLPILDFSAMGGSVVVDSQDEVRPRTGAYAAGGAGSLKWADRIAIAEGELYIAESAVQIVTLEGGVAELQVHTQGCPVILLIPSCVATADPGGDAAVGTAATIGDI